MKYVNIALAHALQKPITTDETEERNTLAGAFFIHQAHSCA